MVKTVEIVSLSRGLLGEPSAKHEVDRGLERLGALGIRVKIAPHAADGIDRLKSRPEDRAADLLGALRDETVDMILCAIGGDDTYRLLPYLFENGELAAAVRDKIFLGFSDTTVNHFMLNRVGMRTYYGQAFIPDVCEFDRTMLPYTEKYFKELLATGAIERITPSAVWYESRKSFGIDQMDVPLVTHENGGFELLTGEPRFSGRILGGCVDTIYYMFDPERYSDMPELVRRYGIFPDADGWRGKILLLESSEEKPCLEKYRRALRYLDGAGVLDAVTGVVAGKPMDGAFHEEYKKILAEFARPRGLPVLANVSVGHAQPRAIVPLGVTATVDADAQTIVFDTEEQKKKAPFVS